MAKVSDYKLVSAIIKGIGKVLTGMTFVDLPVVFDETGTEQRFGLVEGKLHVGGTSTLPQTMYQIIMTYLNQSEAITGRKVFESDQQKQAVMVTAATYLRRLAHGDLSMPEAKPDQPVAMRLYQSPFVWIMMKNVICPIQGVATNNLQCVSFSSPQLDVAAFVEQPEDRSFLFINGDIQYEPLRCAAMLLGAMAGHGMSPSKVVSDLRGSEVWGKVIGYAKLALKEEGASDFEQYMLSLTGIDYASTEALVRNASGSDTNVKTAQYFSDGLGATWQFVGLLEKMLDPARGNDWSTHERLQPWLEALWNKVEKARQKKGREGLSLEALLRVRSPETPKEKIKIIEKMLSSDRVW